MPALQRDQRIGVDAKQPPRRAVALTVFERLRLRLVSYEVAEHGVLEAIHEVHEFVIAQNFKHPSLGVVVIDGMKALLSLHVTDPAIWRSVTSAVTHLPSPMQSEWLNTSSSGMFNRSSMVPMVAHLQSRSSLSCSISLYW